MTQPHTPVPRWGAPAALHLGLALALCLVLVLPGCITFYGEAQVPVRVVITEGMGTGTLTDANLTVREGSSVMDALRQVATVETAFGGGFVDAIDGRESRYPDHRVDWFYHVNGQLSPVGAADRTVTPGDVVLWDHRPWNHTDRLPVVLTGLPAWPELEGTRVQGPEALNTSHGSPLFARVAGTSLLVLDPWHVAAERIQPPWLLAHAIEQDGQPGLLLVASGPEAAGWVDRLHQHRPVGLGLVLNATASQEVPA